MRSSNGGGDNSSKGQGGGVTWRQQHWQERGRCSDNSCKDNSKGETAREGNRVMTNIVATAVARLAATVVARATGSAATSVEYRADGDSGNEDKDGSKGNSSKNGERNGNNGGSASHLCLIFFFLGGLMTQSQGLFICSIHNCHMMTQTTVRQYT